MAKNLGYSTFFFITIPLALIALPPLMRLDVEFRRKREELIYYFKASAAQRVLFKQKNPPRRLDKGTVVRLVKIYLYFFS
jgi:hypothetical protein